jgi:hypothetical protein
MNPKMDLTNPVVIEMLRSCKESGYVDCGDFDCGPCPFSIEATNNKSGPCGGHDKEQNVLNRAERRAFAKALLKKIEE